MDDRGDRFPSAGAASSGRLRTAPGGTEMPDLGGKNWSRTVAITQVQELQALAHYKPHHLTSIFTAGCLEAFLHYLKGRAPWVE
jgi:hypothetical protein